MVTTIGLVGCGRWGMNHYRTLASLRTRGFVDRVVVCDTNPLTLIGLDADETYTTLQAMMEAETLDGVAIVTPPETHLELAQNLLAQNIPLFIEKPLTDEHEKAVDFLSALPSSTILVTGYLLRHHPGLQRMKAAIEDRELQVEVLSYQRRTTRPKPPELDVVSTLAVHGLDATTFLLDAPLMSMDITRFHRSHNSAQIWLRHGGQVVLIDVAWEAEKEQRLIGVQGTLRGAVLDFGTGEFSWHVGDGFDEKPLVEQFASEPLEQEWLYFLEKISIQSPCVFPPASTLLDISSWLNEHGGQEPI